ncbi:MAG: hypothetical protein UX31_C0015G0019 [Candidatus Nomurabacteria bacterium GW2011_GWA1_46_11]|uniref:Uncharacterized protein n=1 Tax=Candidatus Nomurabacteria bacterium GW2011_GWA1_46_11 TaxID=1618732 RepID=A0A0G1QV80_9BACT|nr:MAG: hypothetical protein UW69_C0024G0014 [Microgenomates group bacterium GW2011_GWA2_44_7]KKT77410.1 MAG: hypothetical protein UW73_C0021G0043 [Microgenomates group bacterium GW2011_GWB1_44_8]KKU21693.1 MAG: hypothetical protein UX31_C0015G0019 [Candidatus Nomurabacteria bacterium GW2011_GWA1_46_11]
MNEAVADQRTPIKVIVSRARRAFLILLVLFIIASGSAIYAGWTSGEIKQKIIKPIEQGLTKLGEQLASETEKPINTPAASLLPEPRKESPTPPSSQKENRPVSPKRRECYRYTVTHLDASSSSRCYSSSDYNQLVDLGGNLSTAKTFYQFHLDGALRYQDEYGRTRSSIYLDAKASEEHQAQREKDKIGQITGQMQQIEQRGY